MSMALPLREQSFSQQLRLRRQLVGARQGAATHRFWSHPDVAQIYPSFLFRSYCNARAAGSMYEAAAARLESMRGDDPVAAGLFRFLQHFALEEMGHDEWLLEDLEALGVSRQQVLARIPPPAIAALVGAQYYWIAHHHPVSILGYCFVGETTPAPADKVEDLIRRTGYPRTAFRSLLRHAVIDLKHGPEVEDVIDSLPLTSDHLAMIGVSMAHTLQSIALSTEEICDLHELRKKAEAGESPAAGQIRLY